MCPFIDGFWLVCLCALPIQDTKFMFSLRQLTINRKLFVIIYLRCRVDTLFDLLCLVLSRSIQFSCTPISCLWLPFLLLIFVCRLQWCRTVWFFAISLNFVFLFRFSFGTVAKVSHCELNYCAITARFVKNQKSCQKHRKFRCWRWLGLRRQCRLRGN